MNNKDLQRLKEITIMDDDFGRIVFQDIASGLELLRILGFINNDSIITHYETQADIKQLSNHSIELDVYVISEESEIDIEFENKRQRAVPKRIRLHASEMDVHMSYAGMEFQDLPNNIIIFICNFDYFNSGLPFYIIKRTVKALNIDFDDGSTIIYLNATYKGNDKFGELYDDLNCAVPAQIKNKVFRKRLHFLKETIGGQRQMCKIWDDIRKEGHDKGIEEGISKGIVEGEMKERTKSIKQLMKNLHCNIEKAMSILGIPENEWDETRKLVQE